MPKFRGEALIAEVAVIPAGRFISPTFRAGLQYAELLEVLDDEDVSSVLKSFDYDLDLLDPPPGVTIDIDDENLREWVAAQRRSR